MARMDNNAFTLVEVVVTIGLTSMVAAAIFVLLDSGMRIHESGEVNTRSAGAVSRAVLLIRGDIARASAVSHVSSDSLRLDLPDGSQVGFGFHSAGSNVQVMRWVNDGGGWTPRPARPIAVLLPGPGDPPSIGFQNSGSGVDVILVSAGIAMNFHASPWGNP